MSDIQPQYTVGENGEPVFMGWKDTASPLRKFMAGFAGIQRPNVGSMNAQYLAQKQLADAQASRAIELQKLVNSGQLTIEQTRGLNAANLQKLVDSGQLTLEQARGLNQLNLQKEVNSGNLAITDRAGRTSVDVARAPYAPEVLANQREIAFRNAQAQENIAGAPYGEGAQSLKRIEGSNALDLANAQGRSSVDLVNAQGWNAREADWAKNAFNANEALQARVAAAEEARKVRDHELSRMTLGHDLSVYKDNNLPALQGSLVNFIPKARSTLDSAAAAADANAARFRADEKATENLSNAGVIERARIADLTKGSAVDVSPSHTTVLPNLGGPSMGVNVISGAVPPVAGPTGNSPYLSPNINSIGVTERTTASQPSAQNFVDPQSVARAAAASEFLNSPTNVVIPTNSIVSPTNSKAAVINKALSKGGPTVNYKPGQKPNRGE